ncbi:hypothetical protein LRY65_00510 [Candidatus Woesebacteria bacterium]|nr:hypothetical protein [Candidatus Woesebacteria bacterium]MCD8507052.1 hypothetical protein [Candidatus Woesebacteria bacterium]MCD8526682.1 hypothetical protein [Candidatus Woesebacteria bacterium]MCD8546707.1 hypothetical protein [Candidatus Woesebacteria bacterium]
MYGLPPQEIATIDTSLLRSPEPAWKVSFTRLASATSELSVTQLRPWMALSLVAVLPLGFIFWSQPTTPQLRAHNQQLVSSYLAQQQQPGNQIASTFSETAPESDTATTDTPVDAQLVSATTSSPETNSTATDLVNSQVILSTEQKAYRYHLTLAQGFLRKAIQLSQSTAGTQTNADRDSIMQYLDEALAAANTAIDLDPTNGLGFLLRARIYTTASAINPELAAKGDQDLVIAQALGVQDVNILEESVLDQLPTQQANNNLASGPIVADAEEGSDTTIGTKTADNALQGEVVLPAQQTEIFVPFTGLTDTMQITVEVSPNSASQPHTPFRVSSRKSGEGFTIQSFNPLEENVTLFWRITE